MTLSIEALVHRYPGQATLTLNGLSLQLGQGALAAVLGRSGAGKSTLLRCVLGLEPFEAGRVEVDGVTLRGTGETPPQARRRAIAALRGRLGCVFQSLELFPHLTALENCALALRHVQGLGEAEARARARARLCELGLEAQLDGWPAQLSGGQRQRVAIARALALEPRVLLYDEPTSALDASLRGELLQVLRRVRERGVTQVVVTHDLQFARGLDTVCMLDHGVVIEAGAAEQVLSAPSHESTRALLAAWGEGARP